MFLLPVFRAVTLDTGAVAVCITADHCRTTTDGILTPTELVAEAALLGLPAIALADHDNVDGISEALAAGRKYCVKEIREATEKRR
jgi:DNA polymerase III alpha subunit